MEPRDSTGRAPAGAEQLVQRIESGISWSDLALPSSQEEALRAVAHRAQRQSGATVPRTRDSGAVAPSGVTALFVGPDSATAVRAAEVLANELGRGLYRVDLSRVVSQYIGETEKNLNRVLEAAEGGGWVLFFDDADALFGKINHLLERLEAFDGLAILAANRKSALDDAFVRRIRHVVRFPDA